MHESEKWKWSRSVVSDPSRPQGLQPTRLLRPWDFPGKSTRVGCHCLLWFKQQPSSNLCIYPRSLSRCLIHIFSFIFSSFTQMSHRNFKLNMSKMYFTIYFQAPLSYQVLKSVIRESTLTPTSLFPSSNHQILSILIPKHLQVLFTSFHYYWHWFILAINIHTKSL